MLNRLLIAAGAAAILALPATAQNAQAINGQAISISGGEV